MRPAAPTPRRPLRAVVFDLDDTLYAERDYVRSGFRAVAMHLARMQPDMAGSDEWMWGEFLRGRREHIFEAAGEHFGLKKLSRENTLELVEVYRGHAPRIKPLAEMPAILERLRGRVKLALLSDGYLPAQEHKLEALGLRGSFAAILFTESLGREFWKPSPAGFERLQRELDVSPGACAYVADNPAKDFVAPNRLGWLSVQYRFEGQLHADNPAPAGGEPQLVARGAQELTAILEPLLP